MHDKIYLDSHPFAYSFQLSDNRDVFNCEMFDSMHMLFGDDKKMMLRSWSAVREGNIVFIFVE